MVTNDGVDCSISPGPLEAHDAGRQLGPEAELLAEAAGEVLAAPADVLRQLADRTSCRPERTSMLPGVAQLRRHHDLRADQPGEHLVARREPRGP